METKTSIALEKKKRELENARTLLSKYDWLFSQKSMTDLECSLKGETKQLENELNKISQLEAQHSRLNTGLATYKPEITALQDQVKSLSDVKRRLNEATEFQGTLQTRKQEAIERLGLPEKDLEMLSQDLKIQKKNRLTLFGITLIIGLACLALAFLTTIFLLAGAIILFTLSAYFFAQFLKMDKIATENIEIEATNKQIRDQEGRILEIQSEEANLIAQSPYKTPEDAQNHLITVLNQMKTETGESSVEGTEAILRNIAADLSEKRRNNPQERKTTLHRQIKDVETKLADLQKAKPTSVDEIQYSEEQHNSIRNQRETIQTEWNNIKEEVDGDAATIKQLEKDLERLEPDYELCPQLEKEVQGNKEKSQLLKFVNTQLTETSKDLRNKVLPHARLIVNQILPTLTNDRYSDFEITEDLKFKVYSREGGGYKEREIFSGGTQDQFLIALRLVFTQSILDSRVMADKYSLLMDECTSSSDEMRKQGIFEVLDAMKQTFSQIFIIAHEDIANYVDNHLVFERNINGFTEIKSRSWMQ